MVARRRSQIAVRCCIVDHLDLAEQAVFQIGRDFLRPDVVDEELAQPAVPKAQNHAAILSETVYHPMTQIAMAGNAYIRGLPESTFAAFRVVEVPACLISAALQTFPSNVSCLPHW